MFKCYYLVVMQTLSYLWLFCTKVHNVTGNKYKFAQFVHDDSYKSPQVWSVAKYDFNVL